MVCIYLPKNNNLKKLCHYKRYWRPCLSVDFSVLYIQKLQKLSYIKLYCNEICMCLSLNVIFNILVHFNDCFCLIFTLCLCRSMPEITSNARTSSMGESVEPVTKVNDDVGRGRKCRSFEFVSTKPTRFSESILRDLGRPVYRKDIFYG